jgi:hypothetical protein
MDRRTGAKSDLRRAIDGEEPGLHGYGRTVTGAGNRGERRQSSDPGSGTAVVPEVPEAARQLRRFEDLFGWISHSFELVVDNRTQLVQSQFATGNYFDTLLEAA